MRLAGGEEKGNKEECLEGNGSVNRVQYICEGLG